MRLLFIVTVSLLLFASSPSLAQTPEAADKDQEERRLIVGPIPTLPEKLQPKWIKVCEPPDETSHSCVVSADLRNEEGLSIVSVGVKTDGHDRISLIVALPVGVYLPTGYVASVDDEPIDVRGVFQVCQPTACISETQIGEAALGALRRGSTLAIAFALGSGQPVSARVPLLGISAALDGGAIDREALAKHNEAVDAKLRSVAARYNDTEFQQNHEIESDEND